MPTKKAVKETKPADEDQTVDIDATSASQGSDYLKKLGVSITLDYDKLKCTNKDDYEKIFKKYNSIYIQISEILSAIEQQKVLMIDVLHNIQRDYVTFKKAQGDDADNSDEDTTNDEEKAEKNTQDDDIDSDNEDKPVVKKSAKTSASPSKITKTKKTKDVSTDVKDTKQIANDNEKKDTKQIANDDEKIEVKPKKKGGKK